MNEGTTEQQNNLELDRKKGLGKELDYENARRV